MSTMTIEERLAEIRRRIDQLQGRAQAVADEAKPRIQAHFEALRHEEAAARAAARDAADEVEDKLAQLDARVDVAEKSLAADVAEDGAKLEAAVEAELRSWDGYVERLQMKAATRTGEARASAEAAVGDLRKRRIAVAEQLTQVGTASAEVWAEQKKRLAAERLELERKADDLAAKLR